MLPTATLLTRKSFRQNFLPPPVRFGSYASRTATLRGYPKSSDAVRINDLSLNVYFRDGTQWMSQSLTPLLQPVRLSLTVAQDLRKVAKTDDLRHTLNYALLAASLTESHNNRTFGSLGDFVEDVVRQSFENFDQIRDMSVTATKPKALLCGKAVTLHSSWSRDAPAAKSTMFSLEEVEIPVIIGVNPEERIGRQLVRINLTFSNPVSCAVIDYQDLAARLHDLVDSSSFLTVEAFASFIAHRMLLDVRNQWKQITIAVAKPNALPLADSSEVEITRTLADYPLQETPPKLLSSLIAGITPSDDRVQLPHKVAIALGSNLGDRFANLEAALRLLETPQAFLDDKFAELAVVDTSFLYETAPMYVTDQPKFINCTCMVETNLSPIVLLNVLKKIETTVGRVPSIKNGPRAVDLDILLYDDEIIDTRVPNQRSSFDNLEGELVVPHLRISEREFVLRPLNDMIPEHIIPSLRKSVHTLLETLVVTQPPGTPVMRKVIPFPKYPLVPCTSKHPILPVHFSMVPPTATYWTFPLAGERPQKTYIMATLNTTPDSFSDGPKHNALPAALKYTALSLANGADIIDIGGYSTRPHAEYVSPANEMGRVVPVIQEIRKAEDTGNGNVPLVSIDTFRYDVAKAAVLAGANCINDVYAFTGPEYPLSTRSAEHFLKMRKVARDLAVPVILMHSRGEASANKEYSDYQNTDRLSSVVEGVRVELGNKVDAAVKGRGGLRRWFVILDPGVGFSKNVKGNLELLRHASYITSSMTICGSRNALSGYPQLVGVSRKSFLGSILTKPGGRYEGRSTAPGERGWATAAAVACAVEQGAVVVRVHDVLEMGDVTRVANALWGGRRGRFSGRRALSLSTAF